MGTAKDDVLVSLRAIREQREGNETAERRAVLRARQLGLSWREIGRALGRDASSVFEKYRHEAESS